MTFFIRIIPALSLAVLLLGLAGGESCHASVMMDEMSFELLDETEFSTTSVETEQGMDSEESRRDVQKSPRKRPGDLLPTGHSTSSTSSGSLTSSTGSVAFLRFTSDVFQMPPLARWMVWEAGIRVPMPPGQDLLRPPQFT